MLALVAENRNRPDLTETEQAAVVARIRQARKQSGLQQREVADSLGMGIATISRLERGESPIRRWHLEAMAGLYSVTFEWLAYGQNQTAKGVELPTTSSGAEAAEPLSSEAPIVRQYRVCPVCGQDGLAPSEVVPHLVGRTCNTVHSLAEATELAASAPIDPQPWAYVLARYESQLDAARKEARFRLRGRQHWRTLIRILKTSRDRMLERGPDKFEIRNPRLDDPYHPQAQGGEWSRLLGDTLESRGRPPGSIDGPKDA